MLKQRIQILQQNHVIRDEVAQFTEKVIDMMAADYPQIDIDRSARFTTHLAMAAERLLKGEEVEALDEEGWQEVQDDPSFPRAEEFCGKMLALCPFTFPENEKQFIMLHICDMLSSS